MSDRNDRSQICYICNGAGGEFDDDDSDLWITCPTCGGIGISPDGFKSDICKTCGEDEVVLNIYMDVYGEAIKFCDLICASDYARQILFSIKINDLSFELDDNLIEYINKADLNCE